MHFHIDGRVAIPMGKSCSSESVYTWNNIEIVPLSEAPIIASVYSDKERKEYLFKALFFKIHDRKTCHLS